MWPASFPIDSNYFWTNAKLPFSTFPSEKYGDRSGKEQRPAPAFTVEQCINFESHSSDKGEGDGNDGDKRRNRWSAEQTDTLVSSWRECFVQLESHKNAEARRKIIAAVNKKGPAKTVWQGKNKLQNLKDRYKDAKSKKKRSGEARNLPKYFDIFDDVLGTRSVVRLGETNKKIIYTNSIAYFGPKDIAE